MISAGNGRERKLERGGEGGYTERSKVVGSDLGGGEEGSLNCDTRRLIRHPRHLFIVLSFAALPHFPIFFLFTSSTHDLLLEFLLMDKNKTKKSSI